MKISLEPYLPKRHIIHHVQENNNHPLKMGADGGIYIISEEDFLNSCPYKDKLEDVSYRIQHIDDVCYYTFYWDTQDISFYYLSSQETEETLVEWIFEKCIYWRVW